MCILAHVATDILFKVHGDLSSFYQQLSSVLQLLPFIMWKNVLFFFFFFFVLAHSQNGRGGGGGGGMKVLAIWGGVWL